MSHATTEVIARNRTLSRLAAGYARRGWAVLPTSGRRPTIEKWESAATADPDEARAAWSTGGEWSGRNVGIACGPSGLVVIDLDIKGGKNGISTFKTLCDELEVDYEGICDTYTVATPSGGLHLYYAAPRNSTIRLSASQLALGVDVRAWGGMVVAAGSEIDGNPYRVINDAPPIPLPPELGRRLVGANPPTKRAERVPGIIAQGERETQLVSMAGTMRRRGMSIEAILAALDVENEVRCVPPVSRADLERISNSVGRYKPIEDPEAVGADDEIEVDPELLSRQLVALETMRVATDTMKARAARRQRAVLGGMVDPMDVLSFVAAGPDPVATCIWGHAVPGGVMGWASNQGLIIAGPPGTGKSTIALQVALRRTGILGGEVLGMPVRSDDHPLVYLALDRADQIRQSIRRMVPDDADPDAVGRLLMIDNLPPTVDLRQPDTFIAWLRTFKASGVVVDSAKDLGFDLNDSSEGQAFNFLVQATLRAGIEILVTHHSRKVPRGDRKPLTLNDLHGSQWVAAGAGSVLMLDGEAGPQAKRLVHVKPLTVPMPPLLLELNTSTGELSYQDDHGDRDSGQGSRTGNVQDQILEALNNRGEATQSALVAETGANSGSVSRALRALADRGRIKRTENGWAIS